MKWLICALVLAAAVSGIARAGGQVARSGPSISGGSEQERTLLAQLLAGMGSGNLRSVRIATLRPGQWSPHPAGAVKVVFAEVPRSPKSMRSWWLGVIVAAAFRDESDLQQLPPVVAFEHDRAGSRIGPRWAGEPLPPRASDEIASALETQIRTGAAAHGAQVARLLIRRPDGLAPELVLSVGQPAAFLRHQLYGFLHDLGFLIPVKAPQVQGVDVRVVNLRGRFVWEGASATRVSTWTERIRPDLAGCDPIPHSHPAPLPGHKHSFKPCPAP